jgi:hypothetical protein
LAHQVRLLELQQGVSLQINNWLGFIIYSIFTLAIVFFGIPLAVYLSKKGIEGLIKHRFNKLPNDFLIASGLGTYAPQVLFYGLFLSALVVWYLFLDKGGNLVNLINEAKLFFKS